MHTHKLYQRAISLVEIPKARKSTKVYRYIINDHVYVVCRGNRLQASCCIIYRVKQRFARDIEKICKTDKWKIIMALSERSENYYNKSLTNQFERVLKSSI